METHCEILDRWSAVREQLPADFDLDGTARARGAFKRGRKVKTPEALLRLALAYGGCGMSLRETCAWAKATGVARLSDPALLERLEKAGPWRADLVGALIAQQAAVPAGRWAGHRLRALDATSICQPGADRTSWRLHVGYDLATGQVDQLELTDGRGAEKLQRLSYRPGDIVLADRYYARPRDLRPVIAAGADFIVRSGWNSLRLLRPDGGAFDLFATLAEVTQQADVQVRVHEGTPQDPAQDPLIVRLVIRRKEPHQAQAEQRRLLKEAKKRGRKPDPRSLEAANFVLLLTSLPVATFATNDVLDLYRFRWQIELAFKRMKSIAHLDALPAKSPGLARAWIYAKLIAFLLAERLAGNAPESPPSGSRKTSRHPVALAAHEDDPSKPARRHSRAQPLGASFWRPRPFTARPARTTPPTSKAIRPPASPLNLARLIHRFGGIERRV
jgi:hypothetical protein